MFYRKCLKVHLHHHEFPLFYNHNCLLIQAVGICCSTSVLSWGGDLITNATNKKISVGQVFICCVPRIIDSEWMSCITHKYWNFGQLQSLTCSELKYVSYLGFNILFLCLCEKVCHPIWKLGLYLLKMH